MSDELREALLARYGETQSVTANPGVASDPSAIHPYFAANYSQLIGDVPHGASVLDVGCGRGGLISWFRERGFTDVRGVDASPLDVEHANAHLGEGVVVLDDALDYLASAPKTYDLIVAKAVVEHIPRDHLLRLLRSLARALRPGGRIIVDVPNMDWLLASHERYMDLTHEGGFTRESLHAYLSLEFASVDVMTSVLAEPTRSQRILRPLAVRLLRRLLYIVGEGASDLAFASRSLIAVARDPHVYAGGRVYSLDDYKSLTVDGDGDGWRSATVKKGHTEELEALARALREGVPWPIPLEQQLQATRISFAVERRLHAAT